MATPSSSPSRPTSHFCSLPMHGGPKSMFRPYCPDGISLTDPKKHFTSGEPCRAYNVQHFRDNIRKSHPPALFLDDTVLTTSLEEPEQESSTQASQTPKPSSPYEDCCSCCPAPDDKSIEEEELDDGMISPLELPPPLLSFGTVDGVKSESILLGSEPKLDLKELDRRLESIVRIERLEKAGLLHAFFALANAARI